MTIAVISMIRGNWGGSEELWADMAEKALKQNHTVIHLSYKVNSLHPRIKHLQEKGLIIYTRPSLIRKSNNLFVRLFDRGLLFLQKRLSKSIHRIFEENPDVILYNGTCYAIGEEKKILKYLAKTKTRFFMLGHFNDDKGSGLSNSSVARIRYAYERSEKVLFIANRSLQSARRDLGYDIPNALVVRNPVNLPDTSILPFPNVNDDFHFAMVGNLRTIHKGQNLALEVLSTPQWGMRNWHLNIFGSGEDEIFLRQLVKEKALHKRITFQGCVTDIKEIWKKNHLLIMPSLMEGMPLAVVEAMLCGRPSVVTDVGGHTEWISEGQEGFIAEAPSVNSIAKAMERAWEHRQNWQQMGIKAHEKAISLYDPQPGMTLLKIITETNS